MVVRPWASDAAAMPLTLALVEAAIIFGAGCAIVLWSESAPVWWSAMGDAAVHGLALALCGVAAFYYNDLYDLRRVPSWGQWARRLPWAAGVGAALLLAGHAPFARCPIGQGRLLAGGLAALGLVMVVRAGAYRLMEGSPGFQRILVVGGGPMAKELVAEFQARPDFRSRLVGLVDDRSEGALPGCARLGAVRDLARIVQEVRPHRVIVALASRRGRMPLKALLDLRLRGVAVEDGVEVYERLTGKTAVEAVTPSSVIFCNGFGPSRADMALARAVSVPAVAAGLVLLAPLFGLIALAIKLDSPGRVFFVQQRFGRAGKPFGLVKFRTMLPARSATSEWARDNSGRLTRVGRWLRRFRLDELPQLLNVLKGDMNLVGPRPHPISNVPLFVMVMRNTPECGEQIPYYALRALARPGITGWAQVRYHYANDVEEEIEKMRYDLYYVKHMSPWLDLRILFETVRIVLRGREFPPEQAGAHRMATRPAVTRAVRAPLRVAAETTPPLELALAPAAPRQGAVGDCGAPPMRSPTLIERRFPEA